MPSSRKALRAWAMSMSVGGKAAQVVFPNRLDRFIMRPVAALDAVGQAPAVALVFRALLRQAGELL